MTDLVDRVNAIAAKASEYEVPVVEVTVPALRKPEGGYVDFMFDREGIYLGQLDARGNLTEVGNRMELNDGFLIRIPWPQLGNPSENRRGRSRDRRNTESAAANMVMPRSGTSRARVLSAFIADRRDGGDGLIDEDVADRLQMNLYTAAPRRTELVNMGWLRASGSYGRTKMDSDSIKWELTPEAIERLNLQ